MGMVHSGRRKHLPRIQFHKLQHAIQRSFRFHTFRSGRSSRRSQFTDGLVLYSQVYADIYYSSLFWRRWHRQIWGDPKSYQMMFFIGRWMLLAIGFRLLLSIFEFTLNSLSYLP